MKCYHCLQIQPTNSIFVPESGQEILLHKVNVHLFNNVHVDFVVRVFDERPFVDGHQAAGVDAVKFNRRLDKLTRDTFFSIERLDAQSKLCKKSQMMYNEAFD